MKLADPARQSLLESPHSGHSTSTLATLTGCPGFVRGFTNFGWPYIKLARIDGLLGVWLTFWPCGKLVLIILAHQRVHLADNLAHSSLGCNTCSVSLQPPLAAASYRHIFHVRRLRTFALCCMCLERLRGSRRGPSCW